MRYGKAIAASTTPQTQPLFGRELDMTENNAGGYGFKITPWQALNRFLILGTEGGSYYVRETPLTLSNLTGVKECIKLDGVRVVNEALAVSDSGRAVKNDAAIFVLAMVIKYGNDEARQHAYAAVQSICRIGTHLFTLAQALSDLDKGWGRGTKKAFARWYTSQEVDKVAYQVAKYQQRNGWSNADLLRLAHPQTTNPKLTALFKWILKGNVTEELPELIRGVEMAKSADLGLTVKLIKEYNLPRECIPTQHLNSNEVWRALLEKMPLTAMIRSLATMTKNGLLTPTSDETQTIAARLSDADYIRKSRVHPITILMAMKQYATGHGFKGSSSWTPVPRIVSALDKAFYLAFDNIEATGQKFYFGLDVSGSMSWDSGSILTAAEAGAAMMMSVVKKEPKYHIYGFSNELVKLDIHDGMSLNNVLDETRNKTYGSTDCSLPMVHALENKLDVDCFVVITDNETYMGKVHPSQALANYREKMGKPNAKLIVLAVTATDFSIADPSDPGMLDIAGFDAAVPTVISEFVKMG